MKSHPNIAAISGTVHKLLNLCASKKEHTSDSWLPLLKNLRDTLEYSCEELDAHIPFKDEDYQLLKKKLIERFLQHRNDVNESTNAIKSLKQKDKLIDRFDWLEDYIGDRKDLTSDDLYIVLYVLFDRIIKRIKNDDYKDYYELSSLMELDTTNIIKTVLPKSKEPVVESEIEILQKRNTSLKKELTYMQAGWVIFFRNESGALSKSELALKYKLSADNLYNYRIKAITIHNSLHLPRSDRSWNSILNDLDIVIAYFEKQNEIPHKEKAKAEKQKVLLKSGMLDDDEKN